MTCSIADELAGQLPLAQLTDREIADQICTLLELRESNISPEHSRRLSRWEEAMISTELERINSMFRPGALQVASRSGKTIIEMVLTSNELNWTHVALATMLAVVNLTVPCSWDKTEPLCVYAIRKIFDEPQFRENRARSAFLYIVLHTSVDISLLSVFVNRYFMETKHELWKVTRQKILAKVAASGRVDMLSPPAVRDILLKDPRAISFSYIIESMSPEFIAENELVVIMTSTCSSILAKPYIFCDVPALHTKLHGAMTHRLFTLCTGLAAMDLPVLLIFEILQAMGDYYCAFTMFHAWEIAKRVKARAVYSLEMSEKVAHSVHC